MECGRPHAGSVADCMRRSRTAYHYAIRGIRKNEAEIVRDRIAESMLNNKAVISGLRLSTSDPILPAAVKL